MLVSIFRQRLVLQFLYLAFLPVALSILLCKFPLPFLTLIEGKNIGENAPR